MKKWILAFSFVLSALMPFFANAQDEGLYDPAAPAGSAFVRFINAGKVEQAFDPSIRGKAYKDVDYGKSTAYLPVKAGDADLKLGTFEAKQNLEEGAFYSAVLQNDALKVVKDTAVTNPAKAVVAFYNMTDKALTLKTADGKVEVVPSTAAGQSGYREINGVEVTLAAFDGETKSAELPAVTLKRGEATTVLVYKAPDGSVKATAEQAKTDTTQ